MYRQSIVRHARLFSSSPNLRKSAIDTVKDAAQKVDKAVAGKIVDGIEAGEQAAAKVQQATRTTSAEAKDQAREAANTAADKTKEAADKAKKQL